MGTIPAARGPRVLFFSGGSALSPLSSALTRYTHNSIHIITPFDSGGSSATLRAAFGTLAVGDLRSRLTALVDPGAQHAQAVRRLMEDRFAHIAVPGGLRDRLAKMAAGTSPMTRVLPPALRDLLRADLGTLADRLPGDFDLRGASVGNLILTGGYLRNDRDINRTLGNFSSAAQLRGIVRPSADADAHLAVRLASGELILGQHEITSASISSPIADMLLIESLEVAAPVEVDAHPLALRLIAQADLICFPMGSFWTSVAANLLPRGIGAAIAAAGCPKIYIPSSGHDPELFGHSLSGAVEAIAKLCRRDAGADTPIEALIDAVILDRDYRRYRVPLDIDRLRVQGIDVLEHDLSNPEAPGRLSPTRLARALCQLAARRR